jgi:hypothetical protein
LCYGICYLFTYGIWVAWTNWKGYKLLLRFAEGIYDALDAVVSMTFLDEVVSSRRLQRLPVQPREEVIVVWWAADEGNVSDDNVG